MNSRFRSPNVNYSETMSTQSLSTTHPCPQVKTARRLADEVLFPTAVATDRGGVIPTAHLQALQDAGLYGIFSTESVGGSNLSNADRDLIIEALAGGCLTTTFIWQQHAGPATATALCDGKAHRYAAGLAKGETRGGVAFAHLLRQGAPVLRAEPCSDGWLVSGTAPYITGWGDVDVVLIAARWQDSVVWGIVPGIESETMSASMLELAAVNSSSTAVITFDQHLVTTDDVTSVVSFESWLESYRMGLRANGSLALGVTGRCLSLLGPSDLDDEYATARHRLDTASVDELPAARANASDLCMRSATMLVAASGGGAVASSHHAQLLARQAMFLLVQSQTSEIRHHQLTRTM
ncbi:MAG TPA: hypothetical protein DCY63_04955 [Acidimicrobiaceae bacterium]|nr:hypothetical protein [Acidimicrobiaceae bacterium]